MSRSVWKGDFVDPKLLFLFYNSLKITEKRKFRIQVWSRRSTILPIFVGTNVEIHDGKKFVNLSITKNMVGYKFGEFALTKRIGRSIHKEAIVSKKILKKTKKK